MDYSFVKMPEIEIAHAAIGSGMATMKPLEQREHLRYLIAHSDIKAIREAATRWLDKLVAGNAESFD